MLDIYGRLQLRFLQHYIAFYSSSAFFHFLSLFLLQLIVYNRRTASILPFCSHFLANSVRLFPLAFSSTPCTPLYLSETLRFGYRWRTFPHGPTLMETTQGGDSEASHRLGVVRLCIHTHACHRLLAPLLDMWIGQKRIRYFALWEISLALSRCLCSPIRSKPTHRYNTFPTRHLAPPL